jgi:uncharacterized protein (TIGR03083 family)
VTTDAVRSTYQQAAAFFLAAVEQVRPDQWDAHGLGEWTVRDLVGHTGRALATVEQYLAQPPQRVEVEGPVEYFLAAMNNPGGSASVAQRGREAGAALGPDPIVPLRATAERILALVATTDLDTLTGSAAGGMRLRDYLPTRTFELTVHTLDLLTAIGGPIDPPPGPLAASLELAADLALRQGKGPAVLHALTGRRPLPADFTVL